MVFKGNAFDLTATLDKEQVCLEIEGLICIYKRYE